MNIFVFLFVTGALDHIQSLVSAGLPSIGLCVLVVVAIAVLSVYLIRAYRRRKPVYRKIDNVSVLFADIEGFYDITRKLSGDELMKRLNDCFSYFDRVTSLCHLTKIKTIGDAYMCVGGLSKRHNHPAFVVLAAIEMQQYLAKQRIKYPDMWKIRIGIHTGTVYAGRLGRIKRTFDTWGPTVNLASRLETLCESGEINISETTYRYVGRFFRCKSNGPLPIQLADENSYHVEWQQPMGTAEDEQCELHKLLDKSVI